MNKTEGKKADLRRHGDLTGEGCINYLFFFSSLVPCSFFNFYNVFSGVLAFGALLMRVGVSFYSIVSFFFSLSFYFT